MCKSRRADQLAQQHFQKGDYTGWFEALYAAASLNTDDIPWADLAPHPGFLAWADRETLAGDNRPAVVVGCGLGDDAEELARRGFAVTAFDISESAIAWCKRRWPDTSVDYQAADLFALPQAWREKFAFVLEIYTVQALPIHLRRQTISHIAGLVAPGGRLLALGRLVELSVGITPVPPWPLIRSDLDAFAEAGLREVRFEDYLDHEDPPVRRFRVEYAR